MAVPEYADELLTLAVDLGGRLLAAFDGCNVLLTRPSPSPSPSPYYHYSNCTFHPNPEQVLPRAFVNLRGRPAKHAKMEQCTAAVGTLLLEFGVLSRLSGQARPHPHPHPKA